MQVFQVQDGTPLYIQYGVHKEWILLPHCEKFANLACFMMPVLF
jgi:hypothetical protein